mmetsp:Transcript_42057/g.107545  ORF Transcript_42057/g.107545 Transcript_42057/m.107545 type:complete len:238 (-) Transcript_42057:1134-1847(-)
MCSASAKLSRLRCTACVPGRCVSTGAPLDAALDLTTDSGPPIQRPAVSGRDSTARVPAVSDAAAATNGAHAARPSSQADSVFPTIEPTRPQAPMSPMAVQRSGVGYSSGVMTLSVFQPATEMQLKPMMATRPIRVAVLLPPTGSAAKTVMQAAEPAMLAPNVRRRPMRSTRNALDMLPGRVDSATSSISKYTCTGSAPRRFMNSGNQSSRPYQPADSAHHTSASSSVVRRSSPPSSA